MNLHLLAEEINECYGEPFLPKGFVRARVTKYGTLWLDIGNRNGEFEEDGSLSGSGVRIDSNYASESALINGGMGLPPNPYDKILRKYERRKPDKEATVEEHYFAGCYNGAEKYKGLVLKMLGGLLLKLAMEAYKEGHKDERNQCKADYSYFEKLAGEMSGIRISGEVT